MLQESVKLKNSVRMLQDSKEIGISDNIVALSGDASRFGLTAASKCWLAENTMIFFVFQ